MKESLTRFSLMDMLENYPGQWVGRGGPIEWSHRSPDLKHLAFFFGGYMKAQICSQSVNTTPDELKTRITAAVVDGAEDISQRAWQEMDCRRYVCRTIDGAHSLIIKCFAPKTFPLVCKKEPLMSKIVQATPLKTYVSLPKLQVPEIQEFSSVRVDIAAFLYTRPCYLVNSKSGNIIRSL
jgi:hypothetical protein